MMAHPSHDLLSVSGLAYSRGGHPLVRDLDFSLKSGEVLTLRGPNGCGKTTLLRILAGLGRWDAGVIAWNDRRADSDPDLLSALSVLIGHKIGLKADLTVVEMLQFWAGIHGEGGRHIEEAIAVFGLKRLVDLPVKFLSAGQQRRCALAQLVMSSRPVWLLDEPMTALDVSGRQALQDCLSRHLRAGGLAIAAAHETGLPEAREIDLADYRAEMACR